MTKDQLRQIFSTMDGNRAQEIREAYYKAIEGHMTLASQLGLADADMVESPTPLLDEHMYAIEALAAMDKSKLGAVLRPTTIEIPRQCTRIVDLTQQGLSFDSRGVCFSVIPVGNGRRQTVKT